MKNSIMNSNNLKKSDPKKSDPKKLDPKKFNPKKLDLKKFNPKKLDLKKFNPKKFNPKKYMKPILAIVCLAAVLFCIGFLTNLIRKYTPSSEVMNTMEYFALHDEKEAALIVDNEILNEQGRVIDDHCYIDLKVAREYLNDRFFWDEQAKAMIYTTPTDIVTIPVGTKKVSIDEHEIDLGYEILKAEGNTAFIALEFVKEYAGFSYEMFHDPDRIVITRLEGSVTYASVRKKTKLRFRGGIKSPILREMAKNEIVRVIEDQEDWKGVLTQDGYYGYILSNKLAPEYTETLTNDYEDPVYTNISKSYKVNLVWHQITSMESNYSLVYDIAAAEGVNVISPTWFSIADDEGNLESYAMTDYVETAHDADMDVWALVDNFTNQINFAKVMNNTASRTRVEDQLIAAAYEYGLDGINIDFEAITEEAVDGYIQFMRELSVKCRSNRLVLSVDVPPPTYTAYYNRKALGTVCDYVIIMGYDEHYYGSEKAGPVASLPYEENGITETLKEVPADKLISGIPFYTRLWATVENEDGSREVTSEAMGMNYAMETLNYHEVEPEWDKKLSVNYGSFIGVGGEFYEIWLEDEQSLKAKLELLKKYDLAGVAEWKLGLEDDSVWKLIMKYLD